MNNELFVSAIKKYVGEAAIEDVLEDLRDPPGRQHSSDELSRSQWYNALSGDQLQYVRAVVSEAVSHTLFGFFAVLDGVRVIDDKHGTFELFYKTEDGQRVLINDSADIGLHDLFNS